jgi:DNA mismatch repair protein MutL
VGRVHRLPPALANQIAAGEVVERPASVVKELVENAIDADARRVRVAIEFGGKTLVAVEDDGVGMSREDAELAVERHATSKIGSAADLAAIRTLGFRGEALPSIASVSRFRLRTRARGALAGTEILIDAGVTRDVRDAGAPEGTLIEVADLFYNLPARRKFLKADTAESAQVSRLVTQLALVAHEIGFVLTSGGRTMIEAPPAGSFEERFFQIYGDRPDLVRVDKSAAHITVQGYVAALAEDGPARGPQHVFVNGRIVRDRTITHAIQQAYSVATIKERSPEVHLFIGVPADRVDVNVHPTKAEVRFLDQGLVHEIIRRAVVDALGATPAPELSLSPLAAPSATFGAGVLPWNLGSSPQAGGGGLEAAGFGLGGASSSPWPAAPSLPPTASSGFQPASNPQPVALLVRPMTPLGQFRNTFIIAADDEGVAIIDQHVAHERVLFERISERLLSGMLESQRLLTPVVMELGAASHDVLVTHAAELVRLGFELEPFGGNSIRVSAVPALLDWTKSEAALRAMAEDLEGLAPGAKVDEALRRTAATMACHAAVKANDPLTREKMQYLLDELRQTAHSSVCPHGRPVVLRLTRREIEKSFERI